MARMKRDARADSVAGWLLGLMLALAVARVAWPMIPAAAAGAAGWCAAALLWTRLARGQRLQALTLAAVGGGGLALAVMRGQPVPLTALAAQNLPILAMLAGVSFLRAAGAGLGAESRTAVPVGAWAYLRTLLGVHLFGAVINLSAVVIIGDRLHAHRALDGRGARLLSRAFCCASCYSPFFGGVALALASTPGSSLGAIAACGMPVAAAALAYAWVAERVRDPAGLADFEGYPVRIESLWLPAVLAAVVMIAHRVAPTVSVLAVITVLAPVVTAVVLVGRQGFTAAGRALERHVTAQLPGMGSELVLFLCAGVLAVGLGAALRAFGVELPLERFDAEVAAMLLVVIVMLAAIGIHPVVPVAVSTPLLAPLMPDPNLLAATYTLAWGIGVAVSPFSGTHLTIQGRYGVNALAFPRWNAGFALTLLGVAVVLLQVYERMSAA